MNTDDNVSLCLFCKQPFKVAYRLSPKRRERMKFCSKACVSRRNWQEGVLARKEYRCEGCNVILPRERSKKTGELKRRRRFCGQCLLVRKSKGVLFGHRTKAELFSIRANWQSARGAIQRHARDMLVRSDQPLACVVCGYSKYVEVAHVKSVSSFSGESTLDEINSVSNLVALCPNHHWEFDNGVLELNI